MPWFWVPRAWWPWRSGSRSERPAPLCAAGAGRAHRPDAHRGHQLAGRVHLPDRAIPGPTTTVTSGSKITRLWRLNGSSKPRKRLISQRTERVLLSEGYRCARHFRLRFQEQSTGTFGTEIKGTPTRAEKAVWKNAGLVGFFLKKGWMNLGPWEQAWRLIKWWPTIQTQASLAAAGSTYLVPVNVTGKFETL